MKYELVVAIYKKGYEDPVQEETVLETDDLEEAQEEFDAIVSNYTEEDEDDTGEAGSDEPDAAE